MSKRPRSPFRKAPKAHPPGSQLGVIRAWHHHNLSLPYRHFWQPETQAALEAGFAGDDEYKSPCNEEIPPRLSTWHRYPSMHEINAWIWLAELSQKYGRKVTIPSVQPPSGMASPHTVLRLYG